MDSQGTILLIHSHLTPGQYCLVVKSILPRGTLPGFKSQLCYLISPDLVTSWDLGHIT